MKYLVVSDNRYLVLPTKFSKGNQPHNDVGWLIKPYLLCTKEEIIGFERFRCVSVFSLSKSRSAIAYTMPRFQIPNIKLYIVPVHLYDYDFFLKQGVLE